MADGTRIDPPPKNVLYATARFAKYAATQVCPPVLVPSPLVISI